MTHLTDDERALIDRARAGDERACRELVGRYEPMVASVVIGMLGGGDDADDAGQETFIRFFRSLDRFRGDSTLRTYLQRIAMNLSLNVLQTRKRTATRVLSIDAADAPDIPDDRTAAADDSAWETVDQVRAALSQLSPDHRAVVVLRLVDGHSTRETADMLGVPEGTVLSRLARALKQMRAILEPYRNTNIRGISNAG